MVKAKTVSKLTKAPYWHTFAEYLLAGHNQADAYRLARPHLKWERATLVAEASKLASDQRVEEYIAGEQVKRANARRKREAKLMTMLDRREICRDVAIAEESNGLTKLAAVKTDAQLAGEWLERQEVSQTVNLQALLAELPQSGLPIAQHVAPALPASQSSAPESSTATPALPSPSAQDWELIEE